MSLAELKKKRNSVEQLQEKLQKLESKGANAAVDARFWKPTRDANGNGSFLIRFLPAPVNENDSFVRIFYSTIQNYRSKKFLNELSLATIGQNDPVAEYFFKFKETGDNRAEWIRRDMKFISNILVIKDPSNPDNEGKVFLFEYGKQIFNKIKNKMSPDDGFEDEAFDPFDPWEGANFKIKVVSKDINMNGKDIKMPNYDNSEFASQSKIGTDAEIEEIYNQEYSLTEFTDGKRFKSYEELKKAADRVLEINSTDSQAEDDNMTEDEQPAPPPKKATQTRAEIEAETIDDGLDEPKPAKKAKPAPKAAVAEETNTSEEDFFNNLLG